MKPSEIKQFLSSYLPKDGNRHAIFVWGEPGIGKSSVTRQVAGELGWGFIDIRLVLLDPTDLRGIPIPKDGEAVWLPPSFLPREGKGILLFDELNVAPPLVQNSALQLVLDNRLGEYVLPEGWRIVAAGNREGEGFVHRMSPPLLNRFVHIDFGVDLEDWVAWAIKNEIVPEVIGFLNYRPEMLMKFDPSRHDKAFPTPRSWEFCSDLLRHTPENLLAEAISGTVGTGACGEFIAFCRVYQKLPDPELVFKGENIVPKELDLKYAFVSALATKAKPKQFNRLIDYSLHLPAEFAVLLVKMLVAKGQEAVFKAPSWKAWRKKYKDVVIPIKE